ncbi:MAG: DUF3990 domain-containing protein [Clostridia bacterium]|nr:DUF3990 domain-containing protein [Clostridia bacterium]
MSIFPNSTTLYHGTLSEIKKADVRVGRGYKDFGKGLYLAASKEQAAETMHDRYRDASVLKGFRPDAVSEHLYEVKLDEHVLEGLNVKFFAEADVEWLEFVLMCRESEGTPHDYDMVIGPTPDDDAMVKIKTYIQAGYGEPDSDEAKRDLLRNLQTENLEIRYFIGKQDVADAAIVSMTEINP